MCVCVCVCVIAIKLCVREFLMTMHLSFMLPGKIRSSRVWQSSFDLSPPAAPRMQLLGGCVVSQSRLVLPRPLPTPLRSSLIGRRLCVQSTSSSSAEQRSEVRHPQIQFKGRQGDTFPCLARYVISLISWPLPSVDNGSRDFDSNWRGSSGIFLEIFRRGED